jgi:hypothetical protein
MHVNYIITDKIRIKDIVYSINNKKVLYFVSFHNPRNLNKIMKNMKQQMRKLYSFDDVLHHTNRIQIIDMYKEYGSPSKKLVDYNSVKHHIDNYMQTIKENF